MAEENLEIKQETVEDDGYMNLTSVEDYNSPKEGTPAERKNVLKGEKIPIKHDKKSAGNFSWPSLWKNGPRRSAFQPYKPSRDGALNASGVDLGGSCSEEDTAETSLCGSPHQRPSSATVMTNLQRGNIQASPAFNTQDMSWFVLLGRGDVTADDLQQMIAQGKDIDCVDEEGLSGLMWAAYHGQIHSVQILLATNRVEVDREGIWGETALMLAATEGHLEILRLLITAGADINHEDHNGSTALMCAVLSDHPHSVNELLQCGADLWMENLDNSTAYDLAADSKSLKCTEERLLDIRIIDTDARSYASRPIMPILRNAEEEKKRKCILASEERHSTFTPLVLCEDGVMAPQMYTFTKSLVERLAEKGHVEHGIMFSWIRTRIGKGGFN